MEIAVIGGGASGLTAAVAARKSGASVTIYESSERVGRKILATGNGRCNLTNINACADNYYVVFFELHKDYHLLRITA